MILGIAAVRGTRGEVRATSRQKVHVRVGSKKLCDPNGITPSKWIPAPAGAVVTCKFCKAEIEKRGAA